MNTYQALMALAQRQPLQAFSLDIDPSRTPDTFRLVLASQRGYLEGEFDGPPVPQFFGYHAIDVLRPALEGLPPQIAFEQLNNKLEGLLNVIVASETDITLLFHDENAPGKFTAHMLVSRHLYAPCEIVHVSDSPLVALTHLWRQYTDLLREPIKE